MDVGRPCEGLSSFLWPLVAGLHNLLDVQWLTPSLHLDVNLFLLLFLCLQWIWRLASSIHPLSFLVPFSIPD